MDLDITNATVAAPKTAEPLHTSSLTSSSLLGSYGLLTAPPDCLLPKLEPCQIDSTIEVSWGARTKSEDHGYEELLSAACVQCKSSDSVSKAPEIIQPNGETLAPFSGYVTTDDRQDSHDVL